MLNFRASKPRVKGGPGPPGPPWIRTWFLLLLQWILLIIGVVNILLNNYYQYQGVKEFHMLARIGCFKNYGFQSF